MAVHTDKYRTGFLPILSIFSVFSRFFMSSSRTLSRYMPKVASNDATRRDLSFGTPHVSFLTLLFIIRSFVYSVFCQNHFVLSFFSKIFCRYTSILGSFDRDFFSLSSYIHFVNFKRVKRVFSPFFL